MKKQISMILIAFNMSILMSSSSGNKGADSPCDDMTNPIEANGWTGKAIYHYKGWSSKTIELMMMDGALTVMDANSGKSFTTIASLMNNGQSISTKFSSEEGLGKKDDEKK